MASLNGFLSRTLFINLRFPGVFQPLRCQLDTELSNVTENVQGVHERNLNFSSYGFQWQARLEEAATNDIVSESHPRDLNFSDPERSRVPFN